MKLPALPRVLTVTLGISLGLVAIGWMFRPTLAQAVTSLGSLRSGTGVTLDAHEQIRQRLQQQLRKPHHDTTFIVRFKEKTDANTIASVHQAAQPQKGKLARLSSAKAKNKASQRELNARKQRTQIVRVDPGKLQSTMEQYALDPNVEAVYPSFKYKAAWTNGGTKNYPDDFDMTPAAGTGDNWNLERINAPVMWKDQNCVGGGSFCGGDSAAVVAIIDTGVAFETYTGDYEYDGTCGDGNCDITFNEAPNLSNMTLWSNSGEDTNGGDEDDNFFCDDLHGVDMAQAFENFFTDDYLPDFTTSCGSSTDIRKEGHPNDDVGHGTFVAGIIAANTNDAARSVGVSHGVSIMPIKANDGPFSQFFFSVVLYDSIIYAVDEGAHVINMSIEIDPNDDYLQEAVAYAEANGVAVVIAAGNGNNSTSFPEPMNSQAIVVGASDPTNNKSTYSNWGTAIDLVAPVGSTAAVGSGVYQQTFSCYAGSGCTEASNFTTAGMSMIYSVGTSFAAPQVSAAAALIKSQFPTATAADIRFILSRAATDIGTAGKDVVFGDGLLNLSGIWNSHFFGSYAQALANGGKQADRFLTGDFNDDSRNDLLRIYNKSSTEQRAYVALSNGTILQPFSLWHSAVGKSTDRFYVGDFNADDRADLLRIYNKSSSEQRAYVAFSTGTGFSPFTLWHPAVGTSTDRWYVGMFNNDTRADLLRMYNKAPNHQRGYVFTSSGTAFNTATNWYENAGNRIDQFFPGDVDNDNDDDLIRISNLASDLQVAYVAANSGSTFGAFSQWSVNLGTSTDRFAVGDFTDDGRTDILRIYNKSTTLQPAYVSQSTGGVFMTAVRWRDNLGRLSDRFLTGDFNGEGSADVFRIYNSSATLQPVYKFLAQ